MTEILAGHQNNRVNQGDCGLPKGICKLCGQPQGQSKEKLELGGEMLHFCCKGCLHVFQIIYYNSKSEITADFKSSDLFRACIGAGVIPTTEESASTDYGNETGLNFVTNRPDEETAGIETVFTIKNLWCASCAWLVEEILRKTDGILGAEVSFMADLVKVTYQPHRISTREIGDKIKRFGFHVVPTEGQNDADQQKTLLRLGIAAILTFNIMMISFSVYGGFFQELGKTGISTLSLPLCLLAAPVVFYSGWPIFLRAWYGLLSGFFSMDSLITVGALTAFFYSFYQMLHGSLHLYFDTSAMLITMVLLGKFVENHARGKACEGINALQDIVSRKVRLVLKGREKWAETTSMQVGDAFVVKSGERVPVDGRVIAGHADVDESVLTGESRPVKKNPEDDVLAGSMLVNGYLRLAATRIGSKSSMGQMLSLVRKAISEKNPVEQLADRITGFFVPLVFLTAAATTVFLIYTGAAADVAILRAVAILVIACPCALGIATPLAKAALIAKGRSRGIIIRDAGAFEQSHRIDALVFDKTGTVTEGNYTMRSFYTPTVDVTEALRRMAAVEYEENHFLAREIRRYAAEKGITFEAAADRQRFPGLGIKGMVNGEDVAIGNSRFMQELKIEMPREIELQAAAAEKKGQTVIFVAWRYRVQAMAACGDVLKPEARELLGILQDMGKRIWLVSGDSQDTTASIAAQLNIRNFEGRARPQNKVNLVRRLQSEGLRVGMVGDGVNDSAALAQADLGIGVGCSPANIMEEAADVTLLGQDVGRIKETLRLSMILTRAVRQNLTLAFLYNGIGIPLAVLGVLNPLLAVMAMLASSLTVIGNTLRLAGMAFPDPGVKTATEKLSEILPKPATLRS